MDGDIGIVEQLGLAIFHERKVVAVDACRDAARQLYMPVLALDIDNVHVVALLVEE